MIYDILHKTLIDPKPLHIRFDKIDGFIRIYEGTRYLTLVGSEKYDAIYNRIRYLLSLKSSITYIFSHNFAKIKIDSYDSLPIEKRFSLHNHYYYQIFLEKWSFKWSSNNHKFLFLV